MQATTTTVSKGDFIQLDSGRSGKVCWFDGPDAFFALMDDTARPERVERANVVKVISGR